MRAALMDGPASAPPAPGPPADDPVYRAVMALRDTDALADAIRKAWTGKQRKLRRLLGVDVVQTHYKPRQRARILARAAFATKAGTRRQYLYVLVYADAATATRRFGGTQAKKPISGRVPAVLFLKDWNAVGWALPNGPKLRQVQACFKDKKLRKFLVRLGIRSQGSTAPVAALQLVRYVPRQRALFRCEPGSGQPAIYIKLYAPGDDAVAARNLAMLDAVGAAVLGFRLPHLIARRPKQRAIVIEEVAGRQLSDLLGAAAPSLLAAVGTALAGLHGGPLQPDAEWTPDGEVAALRNAVADIADALPDLAGELTRMSDRLAGQRLKLDFGARCPIHGNLHGDQILVDGDSIGIVDWDDLCRGDPLYDLGRLIASLLFASRRAGAEPAAAAARLASLLHAYEAATARAVATDRLCWHIAVALLMRAKISGLRTLAPGWIEDVGAAMAESGRVLAGTSAWLPMR